MAQWEWAILLVLVLGIGVAEMISVRRAIRRARDADLSAKAPEGTGSPPQT